MKSFPTIRRRRAQAGIALLISIFILLLISVVAIALIVSSGTESALAGNYRSSTSVYYAAMAGLEEARGRLQPKGSAAFKTTDPTTFLPSPGTPLAMGDTYYLVNPVSGETISPWISGSLYADGQFNQEFSASGYVVPSSPSPTALSIWNRGTLNPGGNPGPLYKWVRINAVSEKSLNVDADADGQADSTTPLYYTGSGFSNTPSAGSQVIELTALAILPNSSQKILQYIVAPAPINVPILAALTLSGSSSSGATFHAPGTNSSYAVKGNDQDCSGFTTGSKYPAIGVFTNTDKTNVTGGIPFAYRPGYTGLFFAPDVENISGSFPDTPGQLDAMAQTIIPNADATVPPGSAATQTAFLSSLGMSPTNPLTVVARDLDVSNWSSTGYGLLLVTGTFTYDPDTTWNGIVLVIGKGIVNNSQNGNYKQINGAMLVAKTRDNLGNILANFGGASMVFNDAMQGNGIRYSSCWVQKAQPLGGYKVLSFHEIAQP